MIVLALVGNGYNTVGRDASHFCYKKGGHR